MPKQIEHYPALVAWSEEDACFVARVPFLRGLSALGDSAEEALRELGQALEAYLESAQDCGTPLPSPTVTLTDLHAIAKLLNLSELSRRTGISVQTIASKLKRGTELTEDEALLITRSLEKAGLLVIPIALGVSQRP
jgi:predicted RNase H-like HicB family nuclease